MLDRITHPELYAEPEHAGAEWIKAQKEEVGRFSEIIKGFFTLENKELNPMYSVVFKYGGALETALVGYSTTFLERSDNPVLAGGALLVFGLLGLSTVALGTKSSVDRRKVLRQRRLSQATA